MKSPRVQVSLSQEQYDLVSRCAAVGGVSMSKFIAEYVEMSVPMLRHMAEIAEKFQEVSEGRRALHSDAIQAAIARGDALMDALLFEDVRAAFAEVETTTPNSTNRGVRS